MHQLFKKRIEKRNIEKFSWSFFAASPIFFFFFCYWQCTYIVLNLQCQKVQNDCQIYLKIAETRMENIVFGKYDPIWARCLYFECISSILFSNLIVKNDENLLVFPTKQFSKHFHFQVLQMTRGTSLPEVVIGSVHEAPPTTGVSQNLNWPESRLENSQTEHA